MFEVCVTNCSPFIKANQITECLKSIGLNPLHVDKKIKASAAFIAFQEGSPAEVIAKINAEGKFKTGDRMKAREAFGRPTITEERLSGMKRSRDEGMAAGGSAAGQQQRGAGSGSAAAAGGAAGGGGGADAKETGEGDVTGPWRDVPYAEQLARKTHDMDGVLYTITQKLRKHILRKEKLPRGALYTPPGALPPTGKAVEAGAAAAAAAAAAPVAADSSAAAGGAAAAATTSAETVAETAAAPTAAEGDVSRAERPRVDQFNPAVIPEAVMQQLPVWLRSSPVTDELQGRMCRMGAIQPSPGLWGYRNKATFTIGFSRDGTPCVGSRVGSFFQDTSIAPARESCSQIPAIAVLVAEAVQAFVQSSPLPPYDMKNHTGVWRSLMVRWSESKKQVMVALMSKPQREGQASTDSSSSAAGAAKVEEESKLETEEEAVERKEEGKGEETEVEEEASAGADGPVVKKQAMEVNSAAAGGAGALTAAASAPDGKASLPLAPVTALYTSEIERFKAVVTGLSWTLQELQAAFPSPFAPSASATAPSESTAAASGAGAAPSPPSSSSEDPSKVIIRVDSLFLQEHEGRSQPPPNLQPQLLAGMAHIEDSMCGMKFRISPGAFFQVNTPAAEQLYYMVRRAAVHGATGLIGEAGAGERGTIPAAVKGKKSKDKESEAAGGTGGEGTAAAEAASASSLTEEMAVEQQAARKNIVLDVCCGTGTIGLVCAEQFGSIVGVELSVEAIEDAKVNAQLNGVPNAVFLCDRAENVMQQLLSIAEEQQKKQEEADADSSSAAAAAAGGAAHAGAASSSAPRRFVAIVDPPRGGLHPNVIRSLRTCKQLKRIVYVSCAPTGSFIEDAIKLCTPQEHSSAIARGPPFRPVAACPVDLFPHTPHTELVTVFERD